MPGKGMKRDRAVFLDRDGTLIQEKGYLKDPSQLVLEQGASEAVSMLNRAGFPVVLITNQSGIVRGYYTEADLKIVHKALNELLADHHARLDAILYCPHHPDGIRKEYQKACTCRKPGTGMVLEAARSLGMSIQGSYMIGDKTTDMEMARCAGMTGILVMTGYGREQWKQSLQASSTPKPDRVADHILEAAQWIVQTETEGIQKPFLPEENPHGLSSISSKWASLPFLTARTERFRGQGQKIVLAHGTFDLLHPGHVRYLQAAKDLGDILIVAITDDRSARAEKGPGRPVTPVEERLEILSALTCVDFCVVTWEEGPLSVLETVRPDVYVQGTDSTETTAPERDMLCHWGGQVRIVGPSKTYAGSRIIHHIRETSKQFRIKNNGG